MAKGRPRFFSSFPSIDLIETFPFFIWFITSNRQNFDALGSETEVATLDTKIKPSNIGYKLLLKMGWQVDKGCGKHNQGIIDPVRLVDGGGQLGLGKQSEYTEKAEKASLI